MSTKKPSSVVDSTTEDGLFARTVLFCTSFVAIVWSDEDIFLNQIKSQIVDEMMVTVSFLQVKGMI